MIIPYCLNIHSGESLAKTRQTITHCACAVKARVAPDKCYPLGLRLGAEAAEQLNVPAALLSFQQLLTENNLLVTGINGFPFGQFHNTQVKTAVYQPDWSTPERLSYTKALSNILAYILPEGIPGNISTLPLAYKAGQNRDQQELFVANITAMAEYLHELKKTTGRKIMLAIEPEPDCLIENSDEIIEWFNKRLIPQGISLLIKHHSSAENILRDHIGICLDTCHFAVEFEDPLTVIRKLEEQQIAIARIQLSSAISTTISTDAVNALKSYIDPVYLHQTRIQLPDGEILSLPDLTEKTLAIALQHTGCTLRTHFHVPLFYDGDQTLQTTNRDLTPEFFSHVGKNRYPLEIETYTFDVLPPEIKPDNIIDSLVMEHEWVLKKL